MCCTLPHLVWLTGYSRIGGKSVTELGYERHWGFCFVLSLFSSLSFLSLSFLLLFPLSFPLTPTLSLSFSFLISSCGNSGIPVDTRVARNWSPPHLPPAQNWGLSIITCPSNSCSRLFDGNLMRYLKAETHSSTASRCLTFRNGVRS